MRTYPSSEFKSSSWPKSVLKKWLNIKGRADEFHSDRCTNSPTVARRKSCSDKDDSHDYWMCQDISGGWSVESSDNLKPPPAPSENLRVFVGTWNVGGRDPRGGIDLTDWLMSTKAPANIYVLGFQEIVPLNAGNVLGSEDRGPAHKWLTLIGQELNPADSASFQKSGVVHPAPNQSPGDGFSDQLSLVDEGDKGELSEFFCPRQVGGSYRLVASKQMVGIFLCVWVQAALIGKVGSVKVSCVGRGIIGYMGNKRHQVVFQSKDIDVDLQRHEGRGFPIKDITLCGVRSKYTNRSDRLIQ